MSEVPRYRFSDSTVVEPLVDSWSAWSHLISPVPASLHLVHHQIKTLESYLLQPEFHVKSAHDPKFAGSRFTNIPVERADDVRALLEGTKVRRGENIRLAGAVTEFHNWLVEEAKGQCLEPFYEQLPDELRGFVELVYDYYHNPTARFIEGLLYESRYYDKGLQSLRFLHLRRDDARPFFMSTPRLAEEDQIDWVIPFEEPRCDELFRLDAVGQPLGYLGELLGLPASRAGRLLPFLSSEPSPPAESWGQPSVRLRYFGHACVLVEWGGMAILTDPYVAAVPTEGGLPRLTYRDLPARIDYVLITHNHQDHIALETLLRLRHRIGCLVVPRSHGFLYGDISLKLLARKIGFGNVVEMDTFDSIELPGGSITGIPFLGEHGDLAHGKTAYVVRAGEEQILFAADSDCLDPGLYENVRRTLGRIGTVFLGTESVGAPLTWHCGPLFPHKPSHQINQTRRYHGSNAQSALRILEALGARRIYNYAMGLEPWLHHLLGLGLEGDSPQLQESNKLLAAARGQGFLAAERLLGARDIYLAQGASGRVATTTVPGAGGRGHQWAPRMETNGAPLSAVQEHLLSRHQSAPGDPANNVQTAVRVVGALDPDLLAQSLSLAVERCEILRSSFNFDGGKPERVVTPTPRPDLRLLDLGGLPESEQRSHAMKLSAEEVRRPIDLARAPLLRAVVLRLASEEHLLLLTAHRIVCDDWSLRVFWEGWAATYEALSNAGEPPPVNWPSYADFAQQRQQEWLEGDAFQTQLDYWVRQLEGGLPACELSAGGRRPSDDTPRLARHSRALGTTLTASLKDLSEREECPLFATLLAAFLTLLFHYTGQEEIGVETTARNRPTPDLETLIGPLANTVVLRTKLAGRLSFLTLLSRVRGVVLGALAHQEIPFHLVKEALAASGLSLPDPPCPALFTLDGAQPEGVTFSGLSWTPVATGGELARHDLALRLRENGRELVGTLEYSADVFDEDAAASLLEDYQLFLQEIVARPAQQLFAFTASSRASWEGARAASAERRPGDVDDQFVF